MAGPSGAPAGKPKPAFRSSCHPRCPPRISFQLAAGPSMPACFEQVGSDRPSPRCRWSREGRRPRRTSPLPDLARRSRRSRFWREVVSRASRGRSAPASPNSVTQTWATCATSGPSPTAASRRYWLRASFQPMRCSSTLMFGLGAWKSAIAPLTSASRVVEAERYGDRISDRGQRHPRQRGARQECCGNRSQHGFLPVACDLRRN